MSKKNLTTAGTVAGVALGGYSLYKMLGGKDNDTWKVVVVAATVVSISVGLMSLATA